MPPFVPPEPPIEPDEPTPPPALNVPYPPPQVGHGSPWAPADAENRDRILDWWRMWFRRVFFPWIAAWTAYWAAQWARIVAYLNEWLDYAGEYIEEHAVAGLSWRRTDDEIVPESTTLVEITPLPNADIRPLLVGEYVSDTTANTNYGVIVSVVDDTHASVEWLGSLRGLRGETGSGLWTTATPIAESGTTPVVLAADPDREPNVGDLVLDSTTEVHYGKIVTVTDPTHVVVEYIGNLQGPPGIADLGVFDLATGVLASGATYQGLMVDQPNMVGAFLLTVSSPAWVRVYASEAYMLADELRTINTPLVIADDHGCYLDFVGVPSELLKTLTPGIMFTDTGDGLWISVRNTDDDPADVAVHFDYRIFRQ